MTGLRVETVVRSIKAMEQRGALEIADGKILWHGRERASRRAERLNRKGPPIMLNTNTTIRSIVADDFRAASVFERHGIDFCCGGTGRLPTPAASSASTRTR